MAEIRTSMKIEGLEELRQAFRRLPIAIQEKVLPGAVAKGAAVIRDEAKALAPILKAPDPRRTPGLLKRMIRSTRGVRRDSEASAFVSVRQLSKKAIAKFKAGRARKRGADNPQDPFYWRFVEFGTSFMPAISFIRKAFDRKKEAAALEIKDALAKGIEAEAPKAGGRFF